MNLLEELARERIVIKFESQEDKVEFLEWYSLNGGGSLLDRDKVETLKDNECILWSYKYSSEIFWNTLKVFEISEFNKMNKYTWKQLKQKYKIGGTRMFKKSDLQIGWILENDCGEKGIWMGRNILGIDWDSDIKGCYLSEDLIIKIALNEIPINKIYKLKDNAYFNRKSIIRGNILDLIWQRKILKPITSLDQLEEVRKEMCEKYGTSFYITNKDGKYEIIFNGIVKQIGVVNITNNIELDISFDSKQYRGLHISLEKPYNTYITEIENKLNAEYNDVVYLDWEYIGELTTNPFRTVDLEKEGYKLKIS